LKEERESSFETVEQIFCSKQVTMETWLVDSGASHHITRSKKSLTTLIEENSQLQVELGDNAKYAVKGIGTTSFQLKSGKPLKMSEVLYVPGVNVYAIIIVLCISIDKSNIRTRSLRNTHS